MPLKADSFSFSIFGIGGRFKYDKSDKDAIDMLFVYLGNRRVIYHDECGDFVEDIKKSIEKIREHITETMLKVISKDTRKILDNIRDECLAFQSKIENGGPEIKNMWIGEFRGIVIFYLWKLAFEHNLELPAKFENILPASLKKHKGKI